MAIRSKLFNALRQTRKTLNTPISELIRKKISIEALDDLENQLLASDMGIGTTELIIDKLSGGKADNPTVLIRSVLLEQLPKPNKIPTIPPKSVVFIVGVNGTGKTTTTAKLANILKEQGRDVSLIGADTYRAAAVEQLEEWARRLNIRLVCNAKSGDPSAVLFDGLKSAGVQNSEVVIVDTAGRLHTYKNLMAELEKMARVVQKRFPEFNLITYLAIDANLGQNSLIQAREFTKLFKIDGAILTKMDGTARGGIAFPLYHELKIPVVYIGIGEKLGDLYPFDAREYVDSILGIEKD